MRALCLLIAGAMLIGCTGDSESDSDFQVFPQNGEYVG